MSPHSSHFQLRYLVLVPVWLQVVLLVAVKMKSLVLLELLLDLVLVLVESLWMPAGVVGVLSLCWGARRLARAVEALQGTRECSLIWSSASGPGTCTPLPGRGS